MATAPETTVSGRALVIAGLVVTVVVTLASVLWGPALREQVRQEDDPRTLREPVASGRYEGQVWEAVGRYDGTANCVELRYRGDVLDRACDARTPRAQTQLPPDGPVIAYGVAREQQTAVTLTLDDGSVVTAPAVAGDLGFPVSFWATELPAGRHVDDTDAELTDQMGGQG